MVRRVAAVELEGLLPLAAPARAAGRRGGDLDRDAIDFDWLERHPRPAARPDLQQLTSRKDPRRFLHS